VASYKEANQVSLALRMKLSNYCWYNFSRVYPTTDGYLVVVGTTKLDNQVRKLIPPLVNGVEVKTEVE
jgi:hypothetical protein